MHIEGGLDYRNDFFMYKQIDAFEFKKNCVKK